MPAGAAIKDQQVSYEYTTENPFQNNAPTWTEIDAQRMAGDSERPAEESVGADMLDGRTSSARKDMSGYSYAIKKHENEGMEIDNLQEYDDNEKPIWVRETPLQDAGIPQVIGGRLGLIPRIAQQ